MFTMEITTQQYYSASSGSFGTATLIFSTSEGTSSVNGANVTPFYGCASVAVSSSGAWYFDQTSIAIQQNSTTSYSFYIFMAEYPGRGMFRITLNGLDTFQYSILAQSPSGCWIYPDNNSRVTKADVGLGNVDNTSDASKPVSTAQQSALDLKANLAGPTFTGTVNCANLTASALITAANVRSTGIMYSSFGSLSATSTMQTIYNFAGKRGFVFLSGTGTVASSIVAFFDNITSAYYISTIARNGNASSSGFLGTTNAGTMIISVQADASKNIQVSSTVNGTVSWSVILV
jgi:hypothetical protein